MRGYKKYKLLKLFLLLLMLCGCGLPHSTYVRPETVTRQQIETILQAVIDKDEETIEELFCPYVREHDEQLKEEIIGMFDFIEGDIVSYDEPEVSRSAWSTTPWDGYVELSMGSYVGNIHTSTGGLYSLGHGAYNVFKDNPDYIGVNGISIFDQNKYSRENGYPEEAQYWIYLPEMFE